MACTVGIELRCGIPTRFLPTIVPFLQGWQPGQLLALAQTSGSLATLLSTGGTQVQPSAH